MLRLTHTVDMSTGFRYGNMELLQTNKGSGPEKEKAV